LERLLIFTRYPQPGLVKTRLIPLLGPEGAALLHYCLTVHTLTWARTLSRQRAVRVEVHFDGGNVTQMANLFGDDWDYFSQSDGDLGKKIIAAVGSTDEPTIIVGTDCPALETTLVAIAFDSLSTSDVVIGPARDGGYYLIGLKRPIARLFMSIPWGGDQVFVTTCDIAQRLDLAVARLECLADVDRPEDIAAMSADSVTGFR